MTSWKNTMSAGGSSVHVVPPVVAGAFARFVRDLDLLAAGLRLPGYSAAIVRDGNVVWSHGWGQADRGGSRGDSRDAAPLGVGVQAAGRRAADAARRGRHYGWFPPTVSALCIKVPERKLTFVMLANSDGMSANVPWTAEGVRGSPIARLFLERFVPRSR